MPKVRMLREPKKLICYVTPEDFAKIYKGCAASRFPENLPCTPEDWWRSLLTVCYMTGWRINEVLSLRREDVDLLAGTAITRAEDNKGKRDECVPLHEIVIEHIKLVLSFGPLVFTWNHHERTLWSEFHRIQRQAGIHLTCHEDHEHTAACHLYSFHDLRRAFATANAETLTADALQALMRHKSYQTTQRYISMGSQLSRAVEKLEVPPVLRGAAS